MFFCEFYGRYCRCIQKLFTCEWYQFFFNHNLKKAMSNGSNKTAEQLLPQQEREEQIRLAAYQRWESKGKRMGADEEDWYEAENSLNENVGD